MQIGDKLPDILGLNQNGEEVKSSDFAGHKLALYFYPKDLTPGCTAQACSLRDGYDDLRAAGYKVLGVSVDDAKKHLRFIDKHSLPFDLIADTDHRLVEMFGVWAEKKMCGKTYMGTLRTTFIFNENGVLEHIMNPKEIKTAQHALQLLELQK